MQHLHNDGRIHDHAATHAHAISDGDQRSNSVALDGKSVPEKTPHLHDRQCCGLTCVSALPVTLNDIVKPAAPVALCEVESYRKVTDNAPPRLYRPPIS